MANVNVTKGPLAGMAPEAAVADAASGPRPRRPYEAPAIEESSAFETLALSCTALANAVACYNYGAGGYTNS